MFGYDPDPKDKPMTEGHQPERRDPSMKPPSKPPKILLGSSPENSEEKIKSAIIDHWRELLKTKIFNKLSNNARDNLKNAAKNIYENRFNCKVESIEVKDLGDGEYRIEAKLSPKYITISFNMDNLNE